MTALNVERSVELTRNADDEAEGSASRPVGLKRRYIMCPEVAFATVLLNRLYARLLSRRSQLNGKK